MAVGSHVCLGLTLITGGVWHTSGKGSVNKDVRELLEHKEGKSHIIHYQVASSALLLLLEETNSSGLGNRAGREEMELTTFRYLK